MWPSSQGAAESAPAVKQLVDRQLAVNVLSIGDEAADAERKRSDAKIFSRGAL